MKRKMITSIILATLIGCSQGESSDPSDVQSSATDLVSLFTGYHGNGRTFSDRTCFLPSEAMDPNGALQKKYLTPHKLTNGEEVNPALEDTRILAKEAKITFHKNAKTSTIARSLNGTLNLDMNISGGGKVAGDVALAMEVGSTDRSATMTLIADYTGRTLGPSDISPDTSEWKLTPYGRAVNAWANHKGLTGERRVNYIAKRCGTHYVNGIKYGAQYVANLRVTTGLKSDRNQFSGNFEVDMKQVEGGAKGESSAEKAASKVDVKLTVYQKGGNPLSISRIDDTDPNISSAQRLANCSVDEFTECIRTFQELLQYGISARSPKFSADQLSGENEAYSINIERVEAEENPNSFFGQFASNQSDHPFVVTGYSFNKYTIEDLACMGILDKSEFDVQSCEGTPAEEKTTLADLPYLHYSLDALEVKMTSLLDILTYAKDAESILSSTSATEVREQVMVPALTKMRRIKEVIFSCRDEPKECGRSVDNINIELSKENYIAQFNSIIDRHLNAYMDQGMEHYCQATTLANLRSKTPGPWHYTMDKIASLLGGVYRKIGPYKSLLEATRLTSSVPSTALTEFCKNLANATAQRTSFDLSNAVIGNDSEEVSQKFMFEPLAYVKNAKNLILHDTSSNYDLIRGISALRDLDSLIISEARIGNHGHVFSSIPTLKHIELYNPQSGDGHAIGDQASQYVSSNILQAIYSRRNFISLKVFKEDKNYVSFNFRDLPYDHMLRSIKEISFLGDSDRYSFENIENYFGFERNSSETECSETHSMQQVRSWIPDIKLKLKLSSDLDLKESPCCRQVRARCEELRLNLGENRFQVSCEAQCY